MAVRTLEPCFWGSIRRRPRTVTRYGGVFMGIERVILYWVSVELGVDSTLEYSVTADLIAWIRGGLEHRGERVLTMRSTQCW